MTSRNSKRYYWLKLNENFFEREEIKVIESMKNGKDYIIFYMKLLLKSVGTEGKLRFREVIPYTPDMLSSITNTDVDTIKVSIDLFTKLGLMEVWDDGTLFMSETQNMIGSETGWAKKKRIQREKEDIVPLKKDIVPLLSPNCPTEIEIEKDIDIDIDKDIHTDKEKDLCMYDEKLKKVVNLLENNIGIIPPILIESISEHSDLFEVDMWKEAIKISANNKIRTVNYVLGILDKWKDSNILTLSDLEALRKEKEIEREGKQKKTYSSPSNKTRFHNFEQRTDKYTADELNKKVEERARKKREEYLKKIGR